MLHMRYAVIAVGVFIVVMPWLKPQAATLVALNSGQSAIIFSQDELPIISQDSFACDRHIYQADQNYTALPNRIFHTAKQSFGVYEHCYLLPVAKPEPLKSGQMIARFVAARDPYTEVVFVLKGQALSPLPAGVYTFKNGGRLQVDAKHRRVGAIRP